MPIISTPDKRVEEIQLRCDCTCSDYVVSRTQWDDGECWFEFMIRDSRYQSHAGIIARIKNACKLLFGKAVVFSDVLITDPTVVRQFAKDLENLSKIDSAD